MKTWERITFQLTNGSSFELVHNIRSTLSYSVEIAFERWVKQTQYPTRDSFIAYLNANNIIKAMPVEQYREMMKAEEITHTSLMPFGQYKDKRMTEIPAKYLTTIFERGWVRHNGVKLYIINNMEELSKRSAKIPQK